MVIIVVLGLYFESLSSFPLFLFCFFLFFFCFFCFSVLYSFSLQFLKTSLFRFVEFLTKEEAKNAKEGLKHTHFYGRHLVIQYAAPDPSVTTLQEQQKKHVETKLKWIE